MAKIKTDPITADQVTEFAMSCSDFHFEMEVRRTTFLNSFLFHHGGTYIDSQTDKPRQFDIRARKVVGGRNVPLAIECKNLRANAPLLISCIPRVENEAFHDVFVTNKTVGCRQVAVDRVYAEYQKQSPVGKTIDQVATLVDGTLVGGDKEVYDKWSQALASANDYVEYARRDDESKDLGDAYYSVIPILVVPDDMLWQINYDLRGQVESGPKQSERVPFYVGRRFTKPGAETFSITHLEIMTLTGLNHFLEGFARHPSGSIGDGWNQWFHGYWSAS